MGTYATGSDEDEDKNGKKKKKSKKVDKDALASKRVIDKESGVARGIDFQFVSNVINFDFPKVIILLCCTAMF